MFLYNMVRFLLDVVVKAIDLWNTMGVPRASLEHGIRPHHRALIGEKIFDPEMTIVPEGCIYTEEWYDTHGNNRIKLLYEGQTIPHTWEHTPFEKEPIRPWIWVGNVQSETDLTRVLDKYLVVGNRITHELIEHVLPGRQLAYMDKTFKQLDFPGDGIVIEENV